MVGFSNKEGYYYPRNTIRYLKNYEITNVNSDFNFEKGSDLYFYIHMNYLNEYEEFNELKLNIDYQIYGQSTSTLKIKSFNFTDVPETSLNISASYKGDISNPDLTLQLSNSEGNLILDITKYAKQIMNENNIICFRMYLELNNGSYVRMKKIDNIINGSILQNKKLLESIALYDEEKAIFDYTNSKVLLNLKPINYDYKGISLVNNGYLIFNENMSLISQSLLNYNFRFDFSKISYDRIIMYDNLNNVHLFYLVDEENNLFKCFENDYLITYDNTNTDFVLNANGIIYIINKSTFKINIVQKNDIILQFEYKNNYLEYIKHIISETNQKTIINIIYSNNNPLTINYLLCNKKMCFTYENNILKSYYIVDTKNNTLINTYMQEFNFNNNVLSSITYDYIYKYNISRQDVENTTYLVIEDDKTKDQLLYAKKSSYLEVKDNYNNITRKYFDNKNNVQYIESLNSKGKVLEKQIVANINRKQNNKNIKCNNLFSEDEFIEFVSTNNIITTIDLSDTRFNTSSLSKVGFKFNSSSTLSERVITYPLNISGNSDEVLSLSCMGKINLNQDIEYFDIGLKIYYENDIQAEESYIQTSFEKGNNDYQFIEHIALTTNKYTNIDLIIKYYGYNEAIISNIIVNKIKNEGNLVYNENNEIVGISNNDNVISCIYKKEDNSDIYITKTDNGTYQEQKIENGNIIYSKNHCNNDFKEYTYTNGLVSKITSTQDSYKSCEEYLYDENDELIAKTKDDKKESYYNINCDQKVIKQTINNNGLLNKEITDYASVERTFTKIFTLNNLQEKNKFYYANGLLSKIENSDNKIYLFNYDEKNRTKSIYFNNIKYIEYEYDPYTNEQIVKKQYQNDNYYNFEYDDFGRLISIYHSGYVNATLPIYTYEYDSLDRISCIKNMDDEIEYSYEYDDLNNIIKEDNKNIEINNVYNQNNLVSKNNIFSDDNEEKIYNYSYSQYSETINNLFQKITNNIYCDYLYPTQNQSFLYSDKLYFSNSIVYDEDLKRNIYKINNPNTLLNFNITNINNRVEENTYRNKIFKRKDYIGKVNSNLSVLSFIKFDSIGSVSTIFEFIEYQNTQNKVNHISLEVLNTNELIIRQYESEVLTKEQRTGLYITNDRWNIIGLSCEYSTNSNSDDEDYDTITVTLNDKMITHVFPSLAIYDYIQLLDTSCNSVNISFLLAGSNKYNKEEMELLYQDFDLLFNEKQTNKKITNTTYEVFNSQYLDKVTLNNTFKTLKNNEPIIVYTNSDYSNSKDRFFKYSNELNKYCYLSNKYKQSYLKYELAVDTSKNFYFSGKFKPLLKDESTYYNLFTVVDSNNEELLKVSYKHPLIYLYHPSLSSPIYNNLPMSYEKFNTFSISVNSTNTTIKINDNEVVLNKLILDEDKMNIIIGNDTSNNSFCGLISDIVFGFTTLTNYQSNETNFINISDEYGRLKNKIINKDNNKLLFTYSYYDELNEDQTKRYSNLINRVKYYDDSEEIISYNENDSIIKKVLIKNNIITKITHYNYDDFNRLIEEVVFEINSNNTLEETKKELFYYNEFGNIIRRVQYKDKELTNEVSYTYTNDNTNRLVSYLDEIANKTYSIDYNNTLYPKYIGDNILEYQGNRLTRYGEVYFEYDSLGKRTRKFDYRNGSSVTTNYIYDNDNLVRQISNNITIDYIYNNTLLEGLRYNNEEYYYVRDITGCIEKIIDKNKKEMVLYRYTSYGEVEAYINPSLTSSEIEIANVLMNNNGFVYKGYYYDVKTGLFWISSRYYNPEWGRWISPDDIEYLDPESVNGLNLYCYCGNDPINLCDPSGHVAVSALIGLVIGLVVELSVDYLEDDSRTLDHSFWEYVGAGVGGAISGGFGATKNVLLRFGGAVLGSVAQGVISENVDYSFERFKKDLFAGVVAFGISEGITILGKTVLRNWTNKSLIGAPKEASKQIKQLSRGWQVKNMKPYTKTILKIANRYGRMFSFYDKFLGGVYSFVTDMSHNILTN